MPRLFASMTSAVTHGVLLNKCKKPTRNPNRRFRRSNYSKSSHLEFAVRDEAPGCVGGGYWDELGRSKFPDTLAPGEIEPMDYG
ncbi:hypothetical protein CC2G_011387 [Coprinopsis cinerea AmutBmut pab1-1]|nr:hypothetical protein CC2G_011387 [Coprinopsis cinerea AmutBmut pab1-1]